MMFAIVSDEIQCTDNYLNEIMQDLALHIFDIVENSITARAQNISITVDEDLVKDLLVIEIIDDGVGVDKKFAKKIAQKMVDPFKTTASEKKVGHDLSLLAEAAKMSNGHLTIRTDIQKGTGIKAIFQHSHSDRKPLGDLADTLYVLLTRYPKINFVYHHTKNGSHFSFDTKQLQVQLQEQSLDSAEGKKIILDKLSRLKQLLFGHVSQTQE
jgi:hypothetical protein